MTKLEKLQIGANALLVSFMRVNVGAEFDVAGRLSNRSISVQKKGAYCTCYGQYDLAEFLMIDSYQAMHNVPFDKDIIDCELSLFYSWENVSFPINEWIKDFPAFVFVLLKIQPKLEERLTFNIESDVINFIREKFGDDANLFAGMGRSEILLLLRGTGFEVLLPSISELRQTITIEKVIKDLTNIPCDPRRPIFADSTTFPLIMHPNLKGDDGYNKLEGNILPMVNVSCNPGYEKIVAQKRFPSCTGVFNCYGNHDVTMIWDNPIPLPQFANELTDFRTATHAINGIRSTSTTFLGTEGIVTDKQEEHPPWKDEFMPEEAPGTNELLSKSASLNPMVKSRLIEFLGRMNSYYMHEDAKVSFEDMSGIHLSIHWCLEELEKASSSHQRHRLNNFVSEIIDLCNNALFQRYAGLETHFETSKHLPFPFLRGINGFISAATCIPCFIFKGLFPKKAIQQIWPGFVVFGLSHSYQLFDGKILSYPASSLHRPVEDWWGITHEVAHAIYRTTDFYNEELPEDIKSYLKEVALSASSHSIDIEEIYSNWFDFRYIFEGNKDRYFPIIWKSWLRWERVWQFREEYILRSFLLYLSTDMDGYRAAQNKGMTEVKEYSKVKFFEMKTIVNAKASEFDAFVEDINDEKIEQMADIARRSEQLFDYLQNKYFDEEIFKNLNPDYPVELLNKHVASLEVGLIVTDDIPSPVKLLHRLYEKYPSSNIDVPLNTTAATVLTLWLKYLRDYRG